MSRHGLEQHGRSEKRGTGIASKIRQTSSLPPPASTGDSPNGHLGRTRSPARGTQSRRNQQRRSLVGRDNQNRRANSNEDGISLETLPSPRSGLSKSVDRLQDRNALLVEVNDSASGPTKSHSKKNEHVDQPPPSTASPGRPACPPREERGCARRGLEHPRVRLVPRGGGRGPARTGGLTPQAAAWPGRGHTCPCARDSRRGPRHARHV